MNIRQRIVETYVPSYAHTYKDWGFVPEPKWYNPSAGSYKHTDRTIWMDSKKTAETKLEYLNPENGKWEDIPTVTETTKVPAKCLSKGCC